MRRLVVSVAVAVVAIAGTATTALAGGSGGPTFGVYAGRSIRHITKAATCNPQAPTTTSDLQCTFNTHGAYFDTSILGDGTYTGTETIDWSTYAFNSTFNANCANVSGNVVYKLNSTSVLRVKLDKPSSFVCEMPQDATFHNVNVTEIVTGGTGKFSKVVKATSWIGVTGASLPTATAGSYLDSGTESTNLTTH
jgi:hypothetical protein